MKANKRRVQYSLKNIYILLQFTILQYLQFIFQNIIIMGQSVADPIPTAVHSAVQ